MRNLYVTDLKRILKDKLFMVTCILAGVFALINPLLNKLLFSFLGIEDILGSTVNAKSMFFAAFAPGDNLGLIMPILISIIVCKDFSQGTVRNKIISGKSRTTIFLSHLFSSATVMCAIMLLHALLTLVISLLFFPYQETSFTLGDFGYILASVFFAMLVFFAISAITTFFATCAKNIGICILLYLAVSLGLSIIGTIFQVAVIFVDPETTSYTVIEFLNALNIYTSTLIGAGTSYGVKEVIYAILPSVMITAGVTLFGIYRFNRKNLK